jgi:hypothetical protein
MKLRFTEGMLLLGLLSGSGWLVTQVYPSMLPSAAVGCIHLAVAGLSALAVCAIKRKVWAMPSAEFSTAIALAGACVFAMPVATLQLVEGKVPSYTCAALFCAVPLVVVLASSYASGAAESVLADARHLMVPSLIGLGGALLLFPIEAPGTVRKAAFLALVALCCVVLGVASVWMYRVLQGARLAQAVAIAALASAAALGGFEVALDGPGAVREQLTMAAVGGEALWALAVDVPVVWLTAWLLRGLAPAKASARFLLATLVTLVEGDLLLHIRPSLQDAAGLLLLCLGALLLLYGRDSDEAPTLTLR